MVRSVDFQPLRVVLLAEGDYSLCQGEGGDDSNSYLVLSGIASRQFFRECVLRSLFHA